MAKFKCKLCGYTTEEFDELPEDYKVLEEDELPEDYVCPVCGVPAANFEEQ